MTGHEYEAGVRSRDGAGVKQWIRMRRLVDDRPPVRVWVMWTYSADAPLEVTLTLPSTGGAGWSAWSFDRNLLITGAHLRSGMGNVRVWPVTDCEPAVVCIAMADGREHALLQMDRDTLLNWTAGMLELVPPGAEAGRLDVEECIDRILRAHDG